MFCELYVGIAFEEKKSCVCFVNSMWILHLMGKKISVCFVNFMWVLHFRKKNPMCVLWTPCGYCSLYTFNLVVNKHWECKYCIFCIGEEFCLWKYSGIIKHVYKKWFWIWFMKHYIDKCQKVSRRIP